MRTFHWFFVLTLALFLGGIAAAQQAAPEKTAPPAPCELAGPPVANRGKVPLAGMSQKARIKDIMNSMIVPSSTAVFGSVATVTDATGVHEYKPQTDDEWNAVYASAVMLTEAANLMLVPGRERCLGGRIPVQYQKEFSELVREMVEAGNVAMVAARKHDVDGMSAAGERIDVACDECHEKYQLVEDDPEGNVGKVLGTYKPKAPAPIKK
jgi:hypothetical protein